MKDAQRAHNGYKTITVGGSGADIAGFDSNAIQIAADALKDCGGVVELSEGIFNISGPVRVYSNIHLSGKGRATVLRKTTGASSGFLQDVDYGVFSAILADAGDFRTGMGVHISDSSSSGGWSVSTSKVTAVEGATIHFDRRTLMDYTRANAGVVTNACSMIEAIKVENVRISSLSIDGGKATNFFIDGCRGGAVYLHKASSCIVEDVVVSDYNGDGISWQITEDISVLKCEAKGCAGFGLHPGTGSARSVVEGCSLHDNGIDGMFVCWRVTNGIFRDNSFFSNGNSGICIGHRDTDNLFEENHIYANGRAGVLIRREADGNKADRNMYRRNTVENNGGAEDGCGFLYETTVEGNIIEDNTIRDTGCGRQKAGIVCCGGSASCLAIKSNTMSGHSKGDVVG